MQRQARRKQMIKAAETATVVITNPTHYAVALRYEIEHGRAHRRGQGARSAGRQDQGDRAGPRHSSDGKPAARAGALQDASKWAIAIPSALYHAVAEILVLVYKAQDEVQATRGSTAELSAQPAARDECEAAVNKKPGLTDHASRILRLDHSNRRGRAGVCDAGAAAELRPRPAAHAQHHRVGAGAADGDPDSAPGRSSPSFPASFFC